MLLPRFLAAAGFCCSDVLSRWWPSRSMPLASETRARCCRLRKTLQPAAPSIPSERFRLPATAHWPTGPRHRRPTTGMGRSHREGAGGGNRTGSHRRVAATPYSLSPDEKVVVVAIGRGANAGADLWMQDLERGVLNRFTFGAGFAPTPTWSLDGSHVLFAVRGMGGYDYRIYRKSVTGSAGEELLHNSDMSVLPTGWSPDGQFIVFQRTTLKTATDLWLLPLAGDRKPVLYLETPSNEQAGQFFPISAAASRWLAYQSDESNGDQIYVQDVPAAGPSTRSRQKEAFCRAGDRTERSCFTCRLTRSSWLCRLLIRLERFE